MEKNEDALAVAEIVESPGIEDMEVVVETSSDIGVKILDKAYICPYCQKSYTRFFSMRQHAFRVHGVLHVDLNTDKGRIKCGFDSQCTAAFNSSILYRRHLIHIHHVKIQKVKKKFDTLDDFLAWKSTEEEETHSRFIKGKEDYVNQNGELCFKKRTFKCCRSGRCLMKGSKRRTTMKIGTWCPARMDISYGDDQKFTLIYFKTHVGHGTLDDIYKTSEKKRKEGAVRRQRHRYKALQSEVKTKLEMCMDKIYENKYSVEYLKVLSNKLDLILEAEVDKTETDASVSSENAIIEDNCDWAKLSQAETDKATSEPINVCLKEHAYVTKKRVPIYPRPPSHAERASVKPSANSNSVLTPKMIASTNKILNAVPISPKPKISNDNIILLTTSGYPSVKPPSCPLIFYDNSGNVLQYRNAAAQPPPTYIVTTCDNTVKKDSTLESTKS